MREVRRRRRLGLGTSKQVVSQTQSSELDTDSVRNRLMLKASQLQGMAYTATLSSPYYGMAVSPDDDSLKFPQHLHYFVNGFTPLTFPTAHVQHECDIVKLAMTEGNSALLHALYAVSTIHRDLVERTTVSNRSSITSGDLGRAFLYHKQCAIVSLQKNLSNLDAFQTRSSLATVVLLLLMESLLGDTVTADAHRSGLSELVKRYSRMQSSSYFMVSDMFMSDLKSATTTLSQPSMRLSRNWLSEFDRLKHLPFVPSRPDLALLGSSFVGTRISQCLDPTFVLLMYALRNLISAVEDSFEQRSEVSNINGTHFLILEHRLLSYRSSTNRNDDSSSKLAECCRIGALLYYNLCLWSWPKNSTLICNLVSCLRTAISEWISEKPVGKHFSVVLWLYFVGSFGSSSAQQSLWYLRGMQEVCRSLDMQENDFSSILASFFYVDRLMGLHMKECYKKISSRS